MRPKRRVLSEHDRAVWAVYAQHIRPLDGVAVPGPPAIANEIPAQPGPAVPPSAIQSRPKMRAPGPIDIGTSPGGVDRATWERFRTGKLAPVRTLDLHGRTAARAFVALQGFLHAAYAEQLRCVEVITGRGSGEHGGVIRREFPLWLNLPELRPMVLAAAHPHAANLGSVRLLLRRARGQR